MHECPFCWDLSIYPENAINHGFPYLGQTIIECESCHAKVNIDFDYSFEDGMWRDCSTIRPLKALPWPKTITPQELAKAIIALKQKYPGHFP